MQLVSCGQLTLGASGVVQAGGAGGGRADRVQRREVEVDPLDLRAGGVGNETRSIEADIDLIRILQCALGADAIRNDHRREIGGRGREHPTRSPITAGEVNLADGSSITFIDFSNLEGGSGTDIFTFDHENSGSIRTFEKESKRFTVLRHYAVKLLVYEFSLGEFLPFTRNHARIAASD
mgnify:CR=1 FL=1